MITEQGEISYQEFDEMASQRLENTLDGSVPGYVATVNVDPEVRQVIRRIPETSPYRLKLVTL